MHNIWQVDAKENITTLDGKAACYLTLTDENSGAWLSSIGFAYGRISQVPLWQVRDKLIESFSRWGKPGAMRVDNGETLGHPTMMMTSPLALWLIAMDIDMIFNKPKCPQQNAVVERMQSTSGRWVELDKTKDLSHLQTCLDGEAQLQRQQLPVKRLGNKTRLEAFPNWKYYAGYTESKILMKTESTTSYPKSSIPARYLRQELSATINRSFR